MKLVEKALRESGLYRAAKACRDDIDHHCHGAAEKDLGGFVAFHCEAKAAYRFGQHPGGEWLTVHQHAVAIENNQGIVHASSLSHDRRRAQFVSI